MDGGGSKQNRVRTANSQLKNEHGRSFFSVPAVNLCSRLVSILSICKKANSERLFRTDKDVGGSNQQRCFCGAKTRVRKCARMYTSGQAIFKKANGERLCRTDTDVRGSTQ